MQGRSQPFGKRNRAAGLVTTKPVSAAYVGASPDPHRAFFEAVRAENQIVDTVATAVEVPRSLRAGVLAGIVVACGLAGLDATEKLAAMRGVTEAMPGQPAVQLLVPALILLAVIGGGRAAGTSLLLAHRILARLGHVSHIAYAIGGAAASVAVAMAMLLVLGQAPAHGFAVDALAGAAGGFFYRVFAGTRRMSA